MSYSINTYIVTGGQDTFDLSFAGVTPGYIEEEHVLYYIGNVVQPLSARTFNTETNVTINPVPLDGTEISFRRETSPATALVDWVAGEPITVTLLDLSNTQMLYLAQEAADIGAVGAAEASAGEAEQYADAANVSAIAAATDAQRAEDAVGTMDIDAVALNTAKETNVQTDLSFTRSSNLIAIKSSDGEDILLPGGTSDLAGVLTTEHVAQMDVNTGHTQDTSGNPHHITAGDVNCIAKNNTGAFTPTADYHPCTKKYADANVAEGTGTDLSGGAIDTDVYINSSTGTSFVIPGATSTLAGILTAADKVALTANTAHAGSTSGNPHSVAASDVNCLAKDNTGVYAPTEDYHPATKKYADENSPGTDLSGTVSATILQLNSSTGDYVQIPGATSVYAGIMTATDKVALTANTAKETNVDTDLSYTRTITSVTVQSSDGDNAILPQVSQSYAGVMSAADKIALDANTAKETNVTTDLSFTRDAVTVTVQSSDGTNAVLPVASWALAGVLTGADMLSLDLNTIHRGDTTGNPHSVTASDVNCLSKTNTTSFTPTGDYHPATKKYVDDADGAIANFTPSITFGGSSIGVQYSSINAGICIKRGNEVTVRGMLGLSSKGTSTGSVILGLPYAVKSGYWNYIPVTFNVVDVTFSGMYQGHTLPGTNTMVLNQITDAGVSTSLTNANIANTSRIMFSVTYTTTN